MDKCDSVILENMLLRIICSNCDSCEICKEITKTPFCKRDLLQQRISLEDEVKLAKRLYLKLDYELRNVLFEDMVGEEDILKLIREEIT